jgi:CheY-like chemotaxis protein
MRKFTRILLIDDDPISNFINSQVIKLTGLGEARVTVNGSEAIDYIKNECRNEEVFPDLIIVDINMPVMDGFEFINQYIDLKLKGNSKALIYLLTTSSDPRDIKKSQALGIPMLTKPLTAEMINVLFQDEVTSNLNPNRN